MAGLVPAIHVYLRYAYAKPSDRCPMPTIAYFLGISVRMFFNDHDPPHFHVTYQGHRARVLIANGEVVDGKVPPAVARILKEWAALRNEELMKNWMACRTDGQVERIEGLDT